MKKGLIAVLVIVIIGAAAAVTGVVITGKNGNENVPEQTTVDSGSDAEETEPVVDSGSASDPVQNTDSGVAEDSQDSAEEVIDKEIDTDGVYLTSLSTENKGDFNSIGYGTIMDYTLDVDSFVAHGTFIYGKDENAIYSVSPDKVSDDNKLKNGKYTFKLSPNATFYFTGEEDGPEELNAERFESQLADQTDSNYSLFITVSGGVITEMKLEQ